MRESNVERTRLEKANTTAVRWLILAVVTANLMFVTGNEEAAASVGSLLTITTMLLWIATMKSPQIERGCEILADKIRSKRRETDG